MNLEFVIYPSTFMLAGFALASSFCRIAHIDMKGVQYRYVAPFVLIFLGTLGIVTSLIGGDHSTWYEPVVLLAFCLHLWNTRADWANGMPKHFKRENHDRRGPHRTRTRVAVENTLVVAFVLAAVGVVGISSASGHDALVRLRAPSLQAK